MSSRQAISLVKGGPACTRRAGKLIVLIAFAGALAVTTTTLTGETPSSSSRQTIKAIYIPLADHYAIIVAHEKYRDKMKYAELQIEQFSGPHLIRPRFREGDIDIACTVCPQAMDMFLKKPNFRWISLMHRDGNALAINDLLNAEVQLPDKWIDRKPDDKVANAFVIAKKELGRPTECGVPHLQATHTVVLYKYLKDHGKTLTLGYGDADIVAIEVPPPESPSFIKRKNSRNEAASFEQSLPWADVVETGGYGHVAWYSKDVIPWPNGHVECIAIATDECIKNKRIALQEVIYYIHKAGLDIEFARRAGGEDMIAIAEMIRRHIPEHNKEAIIQSLRPDLMVINYQHLNLDKKGLKVIMDLAVDGGILKEKIDIEAFADTSFSTRITDQPLNLKD
ncbi:MAG: ABC transporter substrate-binding protein [Candidatus Marinimicrobia bacterium]|nr:ABC transporter substrate-binding protein [Candidatus Neomarinimicrobiota bacterium]